MLETQESVRNTGVRVGGEQRGSLRTETSLLEATAGVQLTALCLAPLSVSEWSEDEEC